MAVLIGLHQAGGCEKSADLGFIVSWLRLGRPVRVNGPPFCPGESLGQLSEAPWVAAMRRFGQGQRADCLSVLFKVIGFGGGSGNRTALFSFWGKRVKNPLIPSKIHRSTIEDPSKFHRHITLTTRQQHVRSGLGMPKPASGGLGHWPQSRSPRSSRWQGRRLRVATASQ